MGDNAEFREVPADLATHEPTPVAQPVAADVNAPQSGSEVAPENIGANNQPGYINPNPQTAYSNTSGMEMGAGTALAAETPLLGVAAYKAFNKNKEEGPWTPPKFTPAGQPVDPNVPKDVYNWMAGQHADVPVRGSNQKVAERLAQEHLENKDKLLDFERANPGRSLLDNGLEVSAQEANRIRSAKAEQQQREFQEWKAKQPKAKSAAREHFTPALQAGQVGYGLGSGIQETNPFLAGADYTGAALSAAAPVVQHFHPKGKLGTALQIAGGVLPVASNAISAATHKKGGLVHLAEGGQPEMGVAQAYDPSYNEQIRDKIAPYIGQQQANALMGQQGQAKVDQYNPVGWIAQTPGNIAQGVKDFVNSSKAGDYMGAMGSAFGTAMDVAPMLGKAGKIAKLLRYNAEGQAGQDASALARPYVEKAAGAAAPLIKRVAEYLPKSGTGSVLEGTTLAAHKEGGKVRHPDVQKAVGFAKKLRG